MKNDKKTDSIKKKVVKHLKGDIKTFEKEEEEDEKLIKKLKHPKEDAKERKEYGKKRSDKKFKRVLHEYKEGDLHSGSKHGPKVKDKTQAIAIAFQEARNAYKKNKKRK